MWVTSLGEFFFTEQDEEVDEAVCTQLRASVLIVDQSLSAVC